MAEYIEREAAYRFAQDQLKKETGAYTKGWNNAMNVMKSAFRNNDAIPTADVAPVRHGRWIEQPLDFDLCGIAYYQCSECGKEQQTPSNYCQFCGARMDLVTDCNQVKEGDGE